MSNQGYYQGGPQYPQQAYGGGYPQQGGYPPQQQGYGYNQGPMQYQQGPPPPAPRQKSNRGCFEVCIAALCCCFVADETCECLEGCC